MFLRSLLGKSQPYIKKAILEENLAVGVLVTTTHYIFSTSKGHPFAAQFRVGVAIDGSSTPLRSQRVCHCSNRRHSDNRAFLGLRQVGEVLPLGCEDGTKSKEKKAFLSRCRMRNYVKIIEYPKDLTIMERVCLQKPNSIREGPTRTPFVLLKK